MTRRERQLAQGAFVVLLVLLVLLMCGCDGQRRQLRHQAKAAAHIAKAIALDPSVLKTTKYRDSVVVHDTLVVPGYWTADTLVMYRYDTIFLDTGRLHIKLVRMPGDKVYVRGECEPDTVVKLVAVEFEGDCPPQVQLQPVRVERIAPWWSVLLGAGVLLFMAFMLLKQNKKDNIT